MRMLRMDGNRKYFVSEEKIRHFYYDLGFNQRRTAPAVGCERIHFAGGFDCWEFSLSASS